MGEKRSSHPSASLWKVLNGKHKGGAERELCKGFQVSPCMSWFPFLPSMPIDGTLTLDSDSQIHLGSQRWVSRKVTQYMFSTLPVACFHGEEREK